MFMQASVSLNRRSSGPLPVNNIVTPLTLRAWKIPKPVTVGMRWLSEAPCAPALPHNCLRARSAGRLGILVLYVALQRAC